ncbi:hypothetical protein C5167_048560, partial [Papaver somniferum]
GSSGDADILWLEIQWQRERCPLGAVPIRRTTKQEMIFGSKYHWEKTKQNNSNTYPHTPMYHHFVSIEPVEGKSYHGGYVIMGAHNPSITPEQLSTSQLWIQNGPNEQINSIETGWVAPISGNWWLRFRREVISYWPKELFTHLAHNASIIRYGGIAGAVSKSPSPPMGNGKLPIYKDFDIEKSGFMREMKVYNESGDAVYFDYTKTQKK